MKLIYVVIDGMGDLSIEALDGKTPLEFAETPNLDFLARKGINGLMYPVRKGIAPESDVAVISILGYDPFKYHTGRGPLEAIGSGVAMKDGDLALRCNFATLGAENRLVDRRAGRTLTTEEAMELSEAINDGVDLESPPADFEFKSTVGHRGVLVIHGRKGSLSGNITNTDPAYARAEGLGVAKAKVEMVLKPCEPLDKSEEARISAGLVNEFTQKSHIILDEHEVNKRRVEQGDLKANVILMRDAGHLLPKFFNVNERYGVRFLCLADMPVERGIGKLAGMDLSDLPPPSHDLEEDCKIRVKKLLDLLPNYDGFYLHIKGPDEPGHDGKVHLKVQLIATIDKVLFGELLPRIDLEEHVICVTADHSTPCKLKAHSDDPVPVLISGDRIQGDGVHGFSERECRNGTLGILAQGTELMPKLMGLLRG